MSRYSERWSKMIDIRNAGLQRGDDAEVIGKAISAAYPYGMRSGHCYQQWLEARRDFFRQHGIPMKRGKAG